MRLSVFLAVTATLSLTGSAHAELSWTPFVYRYTAADRTRIPVEGEQARLEVPEDPGQAAGPKLSLFLMRLPATTKNPGPPIVYLHGGPGGAALEHLESPEFRAVFEALRQKADVILLDQRGCGLSRPSLVPTSADRFGTETLATRGAFLDYLLRLSRNVRERLIKGGNDPRHFTILESAEDVESVRTALGVSKIDIFAHSYGTQLAQAYARAHPASVERMILAGSRGMDTSRKLPSEADGVLSGIAELARHDATVGAVFPDLLATMDRVLAKADKSPIAVPIEDENRSVRTYLVGGYALRFIIAKFYLNDPDNARYLPKLLDEIDTGRRPWSLTFNLLQMLRSPVSLTWFTTDAASGVTALRAGRIAAEAGTSRLGDSLNFPFPDINTAWEMSDLGDAFRASVTSNIPTLFLAGSRDGITPVTQTREVMKGFSKAQLLVVENAGHTSMFRAPEVAPAMAGFLGGAAVPATARIEPVPFVPLVTEKTR